MLETILITFGSSTVLFTALGFLSRSIINHYLSKDIETFKTRLKADSDLAQQQLRNSLKLIAVEHEIRFKRLHEKRAEVLDELYAHLSEAVRLTRSFVSIMEWNGEKSKQEKYPETMQKILDFYWYFDKHRIYLTQTQCNLIDAFVDKLREPSIEFSMYLDVSRFDAKSLKEKNKVWRDAWKSVEEKVPLARQALEDEFRKILGVEINVTKE
jgi:hypothetical protein